MNWQDGLLSTSSSENMARCRDDASVSLLPNMRVMPLCQGDSTMYLGTWNIQCFCPKLFGMIYLVHYTKYIVLSTIYVSVTCNPCPIYVSMVQCTCYMVHAIQTIPAQYARHATVCQGECSTCNHRKDSVITRRKICKPNNQMYQRL